MTNILISGQDITRLEQLKKQLTHLNITGENEFNLKTVQPNHLSENLSTNLNFLIIDIKTVNHLIFSFIDQIRQTDYKGPVLVLGERTVKIEPKDFLQVKNLYFLEHSQVESQMVGFVKNCLNFNDIKQRKDQRFDVHEEATLEAYSSDFNAKTVINNISRSGARIEEELSGLHKGDLLRLHFQFEKIKKERQMSAKVVWIKLDGDTIREAGLEFVSQKDVYKYLLERATA